MVNVFETGSARGACRQVTALPDDTRHPDLLKADGVRTRLPLLSRLKRGIDH